MCNRIWQTYIGSSFPMSKASRQQCFYGCWNYNILFITRIAYESLFPIA